MLEPDRLYTLEYRHAITDPWSILAGVDVATDIEVWNVDTRAAVDLGTAAQIRLALVTSLPGVSNVLRENTPTVVEWNNARTGLAYPAAGSTFAGAYTYAVPGTTPGAARGTLAINVQIATRSTGGAAISTIIWYTPGSSGIPTLVGLESSGGSVVLSRINTRETPVYGDPCYSATSRLV